MLDIARLSPRPAGFGRCRACAYRETGTPDICFSCASSGTEHLAPERCRVCELPVAPRESCGNPLCNDRGRWFDCNYAIAMKSGALQNAITLYKFKDQKGWAQIFGRVLVGFLDEREEEFRKFNFITASPTFVGQEESSRSWDHTRLVIEVANEVAEGRWPFDLVTPPAIEKVRPTPRMARKKWRERREIGEGELRRALRVADPPRIREASILVYDDVFTDGRTLDEVARCLRIEGGARRVCGVTLARQPWPPREERK